MGTSRRPHLYCGGSVVSEQNLIYGHIHNNKPDSYWLMLKTYKRALNASVEVDEYQPVSFDELVANNEIW